MSLTLIFGIASLPLPHARQRAKDMIPQIGAASPLVALGRERTDEALLK
jgi:hypothetical protein